LDTEFVIFSFLKYSPFQEGGITHDILFFFLFLKISI
jgi:hypothetical protein